MYSSYDQYQANGGTLPEDRYNILAKQAGYIIDAATMGRARDAPASMAEPLADCECALVDSLAAKQSAGRAEADGIQSFTNDGYSETRATAAESKAALRSLLGRYLTQPVNLLAAAGYAYV